jgi:SAM-dependent methyltransferase
MSQKLSTVGETLSNYYSNTLAQFGPTLAGVDWLKEEDAFLRYQLHLRGVNSCKAKSILDLGCGLGHFFQYISNHPEQNIKNLADNYLGIDPISKMIEHAKNISPQGNFKLGSAESLNQLPKFDFVVANGLFTVKSTASELEMQNFVDKTLDAMWEKSNLGISFNLMSDFVEHRYPRLYYINPSEVINKFAPRFGRHFLIFGETKLYDICYVWFKNPSLGR